MMPPDVQSALWRYVECGGALLVLGGRELPNIWGLKAAPDTTEFDNNHVGFGQCIVTADVNTIHLTPEQWSEIVYSWLKTENSGENRSVG